MENDDPENEVKVKSDFSLSLILNSLYPGATEDKETTIEQLVAWPPDVFAVTAYILQQTGLYMYVVTMFAKERKIWPPNLDEDLKTLLFGEQPSDEGSKEPQWLEAIPVIGLAWNKYVDLSLRGNGNSSDDYIVSKLIVESSVRKWLKILFDYIEKPVDDWLGDIESRGTIQFMQACVQLLAAADESCSGIGFDVKNDDGFVFRAMRYLVGRKSLGSTMCSAYINQMVVSVFPKFHVPQTGITIRSLSHNLAMHRGSEIVPIWHSLTMANLAKTENFNVLIIPYPYEILPSQFSPAPHSFPNQDQYGMFSYKPKVLNGNARKRFIIRILDIIKAAKKCTGHVEWIVMPELALDSPTVAGVLADAILKECPGSGFVCGVLGDDFTNTARVYFKLSGGNTFCRWQEKHHRWLLEEKQITNLGLGGQLSPRLQWWESMRIAKRKLYFYPFRPGLAMSVLICEDLARQEPLGELIRAVGPNFVLALLMDAPQLSGRWPGRYAASLADDPGCAVLTVTSLGMVELSRPPNNVSNQNRTIALWKDPKEGTREISLPVGASGVVLSVSTFSQTEWAADGRCDEGAAERLTLTGVHPIRLE